MPELAVLSALVVDDDPHIRDLVARVLRGHGYVVRTAAGGTEALAEIAREAPAVVVSDLVMPGMGGVELAGLLRTGATPLPVVLFSASADPVKVPGVPFVPHPLRRERLLDAVERALAVA